MDTLSRYNQTSQNQPASGIKINEHTELGEIKTLLRNMDQTHLEVLWYRSQGDNLAKIGEKTDKSEKTIRTKIMQHIYAMLKLSDIHGRTDKLRELDRCCALFRELVATGEIWIESNTPDPQGKKLHKLTFHFKSDDLCSEVTVDVQHELCHDNDSPSPKPATLQTDQTADKVQTTVFAESLSDSEPQRDGQLHKQAAVQAADETQTTLFVASLTDSEQQRDDRLTEQADQASPTSITDLPSARRVDGPGRELFRQPVLWVFSGALIVLAALVVFSLIFLTGNGAKRPPNQDESVAVPDSLPCRHPDVAFNVFPQFSDKEPFVFPLYENYLTCEGVFDRYYSEPIAAKVVYQDQRDDGKFGLFGIPLEGFDATSYSSLCLKLYSAKPSQAAWVKLKDMHDPPNEREISVSIRTIDAWEEYCFAFGQFEGVDINRLESFIIGFDSRLGSAEIWIDDFRFTE